MTSCEIASCPVCGTKSSKFLGTRSGYRMFRCTTCSHLFTPTEPDPKELARLYESYSYETHGLDTVSAATMASLRERLSQLESYRRTGRLLDVGFGQGALLACATQLGWDTHGIEYSRLAVEQALARGFAKATQGDFLRAPYPDQHFDVITMIEVLEHLTNAEEFVVHARRLLRPGGVLYATTPNGFGGSARAIGVDWSVIAPPEHIQLFSPRSMEMVLRRAGFSELRIATHGMNPFEIATQWKKLLPAGLGERANGNSRAATSSAPASSNEQFPSRAPASSNEEPPWSAPLSNTPVSSVAVNERLHQSAHGRILKKLLNQGLATSQLGDSLKIWAVRAAT